MAKFEINIGVNGAASITSVDNSLKSLDSTAKNTQSSLNNTTKSSDALSSSMRSLGSIVAIVGLAELAKTAIKTADTMNLLAGRVALVTKSTQEQVAVQSKLLEIAQKTRQGLEETTGLYTNLATSMQQMGKSQSDVLKTTETINKAIIISGSSTSSAAAAITQLGQAFASGTLRGDELNSILENSKGLAMAIADGMGVPIGKLRTLGSEGKITSEILAKALEKSADSVDAKFSKMPETVGQALTKVKNLAMTTIGDIDKNMQGSKALVGIVNGFEAALISSKSTLMELGGVVEDFGGGVVEVFTNINTSIYETLNYFISLTGEASTKATENFTFFDYFTLGLKTATAGIGMLYDGLIKVINFATMAWAKVTGDTEGVKKAWAVDAILTKEMEARLDNLANSYTNISNAKKTASSIKMPEFDLTTKGTKAGSTGLSKEEEKAQNDRLKKAHDIAQSQLKMLQDESDKKIKLEEDYQSTVLDLAQKSSEDKLDGLAKESLATFNYYNELIAKYAEVAGAETALRTMQAEAIDVIIAKQKELDEQLDNKSAIDSLDEIYGRYEKLIDAQIELAENGMNIDFDFGDGAKELNNIFKATQQLHVGSMKFAKQDMKLQEQFAKKFLEAKGDELKEKELISNFDEDTAKLKKTQHDAELAAYSSLAGAMTSAFEQGSAGAIAFTTLQSALGIASSWAAIANAWALPFPANIPAVAMVASAVMPIISQLGGSGGSGGGSAPITSTGFTAEQNREQIEGTYTPITDRLERQIELLESIDRQGSASQLGIELAVTSFERDTKIWVEDVLGKARQGLVTSSLSASQTAAVDVQAQQATGLDIWKTSGGSIGYDEAVLREGTNLIKTLITMSEESLYTGTLYQQAAIEAGYTWSNMQTFVNIEITKDINEYQNLVSEWALSVVDSMEDLKDAASDFKGYYDDITGSMFYETNRLNEAFSDVDALIGTNSFADYLQTSIEDIKALESFFTEDVFALLMSNDTADIEAQIAAVEELGRVTGQTFDNGARDALDYLESIELVAEAMTKSRENIESFIDSLKTSDQLAADMAFSLGVSLATSVEGLASLFNQLAYDLDGLTDADLDLINANKALLENTDEYQTQIDDLNITLGDASKAIGTLDGALGTIQSTIEKLRAASRTSEQSLQIYYDAIAEAQRLSTTDLYEDFAEAVSKASTATSALFETNNFQTSRDMQFAQLVAANQFEGLEDATLTEIDYLKKIEENTRYQVDALVSTMNSLGVSINSALLEKIAPSDEQKVQDIYTKYDLHKYQTDDSGYNYWEGVSASGLSTSELDKAIAESAYVLLKSWGDIDAAMQIKELSSFAVGTPNVPYDMTANIHKGEMIIPASFSDGIRRGDMLLGGNGETSETSKYIQLLQNEMSGMKQIMMSLLQETAINNAGMRNVTNGYNSMLCEVI